MTPWLLLVLTFVCAFITYESFQWRGWLKGAPFSAIASLWKGNLGHLSGAEQAKVKDRVVGFAGGGQLPWLFLGATIVLAVATFQAFIE